MALIPPISNALARTISASLSSNDSRLLQIIRPLAKCDASEQEQYRHHGYGYVLWIVHHSPPNDAGRRAGLISSSSFFADRRSPCIGCLTSAALRSSPIRGQRYSMISASITLFCMSEPSSLVAPSLARVIDP